MAVAFDIETLERLNVVPLPPITCVCLYDSRDNKQYRLQMWKVEKPELDRNLDIILRLLDESDIIIGFNAVFFDLEFIRQTFPSHVSPSRMSMWTLKTIDMFMCLKYVFKNTCGLNDLLLRNGLKSKTGSGSNAILLAQNGKWDELLDYCMSDTMLTWELFNTNTKTVINISDNWNITWNIFEQEKFLSVCPKHCIMQHAKQPNHVFQPNSIELPDDIHDEYKY
jgi:DNA polymerase elongation subunit (family B)